MSVEMNDHPKTNAKNETVSISISNLTEMETFVSKAMQKSNEFSLEGTKLKEIFDQLAMINSCLKNEVRSNESGYSYWKSVFEKEIKELENNYNELRGSKRSLKQVQRQLECIRKYAEKIKTETEQSKQVLDERRMEREVERHEPKLFWMYKKLLETPLDEKASVREELKVLIREKQSALDAIKNIIGEETEENTEWKDEESWADDLDEHSNPMNMTHSVHLPDPQIPPIAQGHVPLAPPFPLPGHFVNFSYGPSNLYNGSVDRQVQFTNRPFVYYSDDDDDIEDDDEQDIELDLRPII